MAKTAREAYDLALKEVGYSRYADPEQGTKYGRWYAKLTNSPYFGTTGVPYCAMFVSYILHLCGVACTGAPTAACTSGFLRAARSAGKLIRCADARFMDAVLFDWSGGGYYSSNADHVGFIIENHGTWFKTLEGNVSGAVKICTRYPSQIVGCIRPGYASGATSSTQTTVKEDEVYGFKTVSKGSKGNEVMLLQSALNIRQSSDFALDGIFGPYTDSEVRRWQKAKGLYVDGICGPVTWKSVLGA